MNKAELVTYVQTAMGDESSKKAAETAVNAVIDGIKSGIEKDGSVQLVGFGTFSVSTRAARQGVNPRTGEPLQIKESKTVKFKAGAGLKSGL